MSNPSPSASPAPSTRWFLPALALLTVLGVVALGAWLMRPEPAPTARTAFSTQGQPTAADQPPIRTAQAPAPTPISQGNPPAVQVPLAAPTPVAAAQTGNPTTPVVPSGAPASPAAAGAESLTDPLPATQAVAPGEPARLRATVGGVRTPPLSPNQIGVFPRVYIPQSGQADVQVQWPEAAPGDQVVAAVEDGGHFADGKPVQMFTLDESRQIAFQFQASQSPGNFRVSVRHNAQTKVVSFWAGERALALNH